MTHPRITAITVSGVRTLEDVRFDLGGLKVLIGENGSGKSTLLEAMEILRKCAFPDFRSRLVQSHGGMDGLLRWGARSITLGVNVEDDLQCIRYSLQLSSDGTWLTPQADSISVIFSRIAQIQHGSATTLASGAGTLLSEDRGFENPKVQTVRAALRAIEVHAPIDTSAYWATSDAQRNNPARMPQQLQPLSLGGRLSLLGGNVASVYHSLKNDYGPEHWRATLSYLQLGLGTDLDDVGILAAGAGSVTLQAVFGGHPVPVTALSDGQLAYLAVVGAVRLAQGQGSRSLLALDEPDLHLHPELVARVVSLLETAAEDFPIVVATHSNGLLDALENPSEQVVVCDLEMPMRRTVLRRLDSKALASWMERYAGVGSIRAAGFERVVVAQDDPAR